MLCTGTMDPKQMWNYVKSPPETNITLLGMRVLLPKQLLLLYLMNIKYTDSSNFWTDLFFSDFETTSPGSSHCSDCNRCVSENVSNEVIALPLPSGI